MASGQLSLSESSAAKALKEEHRERNRAESQSAIRLRTQAELSVKRKDGDVSNTKHVLGQYTIQFGQYRYNILIFSSLALKK